MRSTDGILTRVSRVRNEYPMLGIAAAKLLPTRDPFASPVRPMARRAGHRGRDATRPGERDLRRRIRQVGIEVLAAGVGQQRHVQVAAGPEYTERRPDRIPWLTAVGFGMPGHLAANASDRPREQSRGRCAAAAGVVHQARPNRIEERHAVEIADTVDPQAERGDARALKASGGGSVIAPHRAR